MQAHIECDNRMATSDQCSKTKSQVEIEDKPPTSILVLPPTGQDCSFIRRTLLVCRLSDDPIQNQVYCSRRVLRPGKVRLADACLLLKNGWPNQSFPLISGTTNWMGPLTLGTTSWTTKCGPLISSGKAGDFVSKLRVHV